LQNFFLFLSCDSFEQIGEQILLQFFYTHFHSLNMHIKQYMTITSIVFLSFPSQHIYKQVLPQNPQSSKVKDETSRNKETINFHKNKFFQENKMLLNLECIFNTYFTCIIHVLYTILSHRWIL
jgi:hypothetical protein